ncbi:unnamed protein product [Parascedosporium putredinis]|uniref:PH domain-containing protein n=1 Tax=Parascedosporium putredinis TaxID=1442378 RepID=A0A9P1MAM6_9PEZI|nr:unnamed protein product [Parascedosporium putredinis]CAI7994634.1 unnamed protein product [Parascedosporium putredinis]
MRRSNSFVASTSDNAQLARGNTLRKKASLRRSGSLGRSSSRRSMRAGSVRSLALQPETDPDQLHSALYCPVPTSGSPTEALATRFQAWRKLLKDLIAYFREIQTHYELRAKNAIKLANAANGLGQHPSFLASGGLSDAVQIIHKYNRSTIQDAQRAQEIEADVILALTGLRADLQQKIKEIKNLSGDFKNTVDKEMDGTRRAVKSLQDVLGRTELDTSMTTGKQDPYLLRLAVDRQVDRQIDEENYLHQAYLNLETSGRDLESIVVGEIQKAYNAYASILRREGDSAFGAIEELHLGPIDMPKDHEWEQFMRKNDEFVNPAVAVRSPENIHYPGRDHPACQEIRAGLLERKSKYLRSYTAGWYVLSPTHLHEFKSADKGQAPLMSLYLPEQKLGSHSKAGTSSQKFILKGRQTGGVHRGHTWVFRAESYDTMMAWYDDIRALTEGGGQAAGGATRSISRASRVSTSSDAGVVDEEDEEPFSAGSQVEMNTIANRQAAQDRRPQAGGRFPSDLQVNAQRGLGTSRSPSTASSNVANSRGRSSIVANGGIPAGGIVAAGALDGSNRGEQSFEEAQHFHNQTYGATPETPMEQAHSHAAKAQREAARDGVNPRAPKPGGTPGYQGTSTPGYQDGNRPQAPTAQVFAAQMQGPTGQSTPATPGQGYNAQDQNQALAHQAYNPREAYGTQSYSSQDLGLAAATQNAPTPQTFSSPPRHRKPMARHGPESEIVSQGPFSHGSNTPNGAAVNGSAVASGAASYLGKPSAGGPVNGIAQGADMEATRSLADREDTVTASVAEAAAPARSEERSEWVETRRTLSDYHVPGQYPRSATNVHITSNGSAI